MQGITLDRMAVFATVAETGSFTAAADKLGMAKSAVSQHISLLERELGAQLLQRSTRKLAITETGEAFLADCRTLLEQAEQLVARVRTGEARPAGLLRLTSAADSADMIAPLIAEYVARHPGVRIDYVPTDRVVDLITERFDLALRTGAMRDSRLHAFKLATFKMIMAASPGYLKQRGTPKRPEELGEHEWIALSALNAPWGRTFISRSGKSTPVRLRGSVSVASAAGMKSLCLCDTGIAAFPDFMVKDDIAGGRLVRLLPNYSLPDIFLFAVWAGHMEPAAKTRAFIDLAKVRLRTPGHRNA